MTMIVKQPFDLARLASVVPGDLIARLDFSPVSMTQLAFYCAAVGVTDPIHYDRDFARRTGFADAVVNGSLRVAWMAESLAMLMPPGAQVRQFDCSHRGLMLVGDAPAYAVRYQSHQVTGPGMWLMQCEIVAAAGDRTCDLGHASVLLPGVADDAA